jgi:hypothetical protein
VAAVAGADRSARANLPIAIPAKSRRNARVSCGKCIGSTCHDILHSRPFCRRALPNHSKPYPRPGRDALPLHDHPPSRQRGFYSAKRSSERHGRLEKVHRSRCPSRNIFDPGPQLPCCALPRFFEPFLEFLEASPNRRRFGKTRTCFSTASVSRPFADATDASLECHKRK